MLMGAPVCGPSMTIESAFPPARPSLRQNPRFALLVLFAINVMNFYDRQVLAAVYRKR